MSAWLSWLCNTDPRTVQGLFTVLAALIGAGTAWWIAVRVYPGQKSIDMDLRLAEEKRQAYMRFFEAAENFAVKTNFGSFGDINAMPQAADFAKFDAVKDELSLRASTEALRACVEFVEVLAMRRKAVHEYLKANANDCVPHKIRETEYLEAVNTSRVKALLAAGEDAGMLRGKRLSRKVSDKVSDADREDLIARLFPVSGTGSDLRDESTAIPPTAPPRS